MGNGDMRVEDAAGLEWTEDTFRGLIGSRPDSARRRALKIMLIYFAVGCSWIFFSDKLLAAIPVEPSARVLFSIAKGVVYVLATSVLIFWLTYPALKRVMDAKETIRKINGELERSNTLYKGLYLEAEREHALLRSLIDSIPDLISYQDTRGVYLGCNKAFEAFTGRTEAEIIGRTHRELFDREGAAASQEAGRVEETVTGPDGERHCLEVLQTPYYDADGKVIGVIDIGRDVSERKRKEDEIRYLSFHDVMTGLYNRAFFQEEKERLDSGRHLPLSVIVGDVNGLKLVNDAFGHAEGDRQLTKIANILKMHCRRCDIAARVGGDEFSILLPRTDEQTARSIVDRIRTACEEHAADPDGRMLYTNISLGFATKTEQPESFDKIMKMAEDFMYRRKLLEHKSLQSSILASIKTTLFEKSNESESHAERMAELAKRLGNKIGLPKEKLDELELAATLHDIGKISIDRKILTKPEALDEEEWREIKKHPAIGYRIASTVPELRHIAEYILCHHERWDGKGYPQGLAGEEIPLLSRIIAIADAFDSMTQERAYRGAMSAGAAADEILRGAGGQFDPGLARAFAETCNEA